MSCLTAKFPTLLSDDAIKIYDIINVSKEWDFSTIDMPSEFIPTVNEISNEGLRLKILNKVVNPVDKKQYIKFEKYDNKKVCLAFSGGLDSVYQALYLRELKYNVHLLHVSNMNAYTNGQELKVAKEFAYQFNFPLEIVQFHKTDKKIWQENPFKDFLIYSICLDWCKSNSCSIISSGDDLRLSIKDAVFETNISDSKELTTLFFNEIKNIQFVSVDASITKDKRLKYLEKLDARDYYDSCVGPGRLTQYLHNKYIKQYNVKLDKWNCASCRKCCSHIWYDYAFNNKKYPDELLERSWKKMSVGADAKFFANKNTFEERKQALLDY